MTWDPWLVVLWFYILWPSLVIGSIAKTWRTIRGTRRELAELKEQNRAVRAVRDAIRGRRCTIWAIVIEVCVPYGMQTIDFRVMFLTHRKGSQSKRIAAPLSMLEQLQGLLESKEPFAFQFPIPGTET